MSEITHARLRELLSYDPLTGQFIWRVNRGRCGKKGTPAGYKDRDGYIVITIRIDGKQHPYRAHRLAWFYVHGVWPKGDVDHRDREVSDNRISELREATRSQNLANIPVHKDSLTGIKGVSFDRRRGTYYARIMKDGQVHRLGSFPDAVSAGAAYAAAAARLFGEFARTS